MISVSASPFHFASLVWDWPIAIYLFLVGVSAGMVTLAILLKRTRPVTEATDCGIVKTTAIIAPLAIMLGLLILIFHLTRPWTFWKLMLHYNFTSVMSLGVMLFQLYMAVLLLWLALLYRTELSILVERYLPGPLQRLNRWLLLCSRGIVPLESLLLLLSILLGAYTGFLLSALKTYPLLNNPLLPILFLFSGLSSGAAAALIGAVAIFKESPHSPSIAFIHRLEMPIIWFELLLLAAFFIGLGFGGADKVVALKNALLGGFWGYLFWFGVVGFRILLPAAVRILCGEQVTQRPMLIIMLSCMTLGGVLLLRFFILYAGQMTSV